MLARHLRSRRINLSGHHQQTRGSAWCGSPARSRAGGSLSFARQIRKPVRSPFAQDDALISWRAVSAGAIWARGASLAGRVLDATAMSPIWRYLTIQISINQHVVHHYYEPMTKDTLDCGRRSLFGSGHSTFPDDNEITMTDDPSELSKQQDHDRRKLNRDYLEVQRLRKGWWLASSRRFPRPRAREPAGLQTAPRQLPVHALQQA